MNGGGDDNPNSGKKMLNQVGKRSMWADAEKQHFIITVTGLKEAHIKYLHIYGEVPPGECYGGSSPSGNSA